MCHAKCADPDITIRDIVFVCIMFDATYLYYVCIFIKVMA